MQKKFSLDASSFLRSKVPVFFALTCFFLVSSYVYYASHFETSGATDAGLTYGFLSMASLLFLNFYKIRKKIYRVRLGTLNTWLKAHVYTGIISLLLVLMHAGFQLSGSFSVFLFSLFLAVVMTGILGSVLYSSMPLFLTREGRAVQTGEEMMEELEEYRKQAEQSVSGASDDFKAIYASRIRSYFQPIRTQWEYLLTEEQGLMNKRKKAFLQLKDFIPSHEAYKLNLLLPVLIKRERVAFRLSRMRILRVWLNLHYPLSAATLTAFAIHLFTVTYY